MRATRGVATGAAIAPPQTAASLAVGRPRGAPCGILLTPTTGATVAAPAPARTRGGAIAACGASSRAVARGAARGAPPERRRAGRGGMPPSAALPSVGTVAGTCPLGCRRPAIVATRGPMAVGTLRTGGTGRVTGAVTTVPCPAATSTRPKGRRGSPPVERMETAVALQAPLDKSKVLRKHQRNVLDPELDEVPPVPVPLFLLLPPRRLAPPRA